MFYASVPLEIMATVWKTTDFINIVTDVNLLLIQIKNADVLVI